LLTAAAYRFGAAHVTPSILGNAADRYYAYRARGAIRSMSSEPLVGTQVFWPNSTGRGHVALYVGNGYVVSTDGDSGDDRPVHLVTMSSLGVPSGWLPTTSL
jgi:cell wall-associated NlpC family hydrolase